MTHSYNEEKKQKVSGDIYAVQGMYLRKLVDLQDKLYSMQRLSSDERRDYAHLIGLLLNDSICMDE